ncbi:unnamed protein product, partial [Candidula unifasciata]
ETGLSTAARLAKYLGKVSNDNPELTQTVAQSQLCALSSLIYVAAAQGDILNSENTTEDNSMIQE